MNCPQCEDTGWVEAPGGVKRCQCRKMQAAPCTELTDRQRAELTAAAVEASQELGAMPDYPNGLESAARKAVADQLIGMCSSPEQIEYVTRRAIALFRSWKGCGVAGLRQILVSKFTARDGIESGPLAISDDYQEGLPSESDGLSGYQIAEGQRARALTEPATKDHLLSAGIKEIAATRRLPTPAYALRPEQRKLPLVPKLPPPTPPPLPDGKQITTADIEAELRKRQNGRISATAPFEPAPAPEER